MINLEKEALLSCAKRLNRLASLENASFHMNKEEDERIKRSIKPYMMWFESVAYDLEKLLNCRKKKDLLKKNN